MNKKYLWTPTRPMLTIERNGSAALGRCYSQGNYKVTSSSRLSKAQLEGMARLGVIPAGQEFGVSSQCDGHEEPAFVDEVPCTVQDIRGNKLDEPAINPWTKQPYTPHRFPYFVYECWERTDSSD